MGEGMGFTPSSIPWHILSTLNGERMNGSIYLLLRVLWACIFTFSSVYSHGLSPAQPDGLTTGLKCHPLIIGQSRA